YADTISAWTHFRHLHHKNSLHALALRKLMAQRINEIKALAIATTEDRELRVALKICAKKFKGLVGKKTEWW
ncbi:MAG: hypothetical protein Q9169_007696, partial [Polycauliona sp. 2 TL-2023]